MAEKIVSPGVFTRENDLSFVQSGVGAIGAAIVGPTVKGPAMVPTQVWTYSEYIQLFGDSFKSGSDYYQYLTSHAAKDYLKHGGPLTVVRILEGDEYGNATSSAHMLAISSAGTAPSQTTTFLAGMGDGVLVQYTSSTGNTYSFIGESGVVPADNAATSTYYWAVTGTAATDATNFASKAQTVLPSTETFSAGAAAQVYFTSSIISNAVPVATIKSGSTAAVPSVNGVASTSSFDTTNTGVPNSGSTTAVFTKSFNIKTFGDGSIMNSTPAATGSNGILTTTGTKDNLRWEVSTINEKKGTFTLLIRRGNDTSKRKAILETHSNLSLDPTATNYVGKVVGTQFNAYDFNNNIVVNSGTYPARSAYVYIEEASIAKTPDYLDDNGDISDTTQTGSLPQVSNGSFQGGSDGTVAHPKNFYEAITQTNMQGLNLGTGQDGETAYTNAINLLSNQDEYDINLIFAPGVNSSQHPGTVTKLITMCEERGDCMTIVDPVGHGSTIASATAESSVKDSSYAAMYWPWVQIADNVTGKYVWVPQSTVMPGIYAFNDKVSAEWFAPAGLNRGGQETVIQAERKLTHANRDTMYEENLNPVATFPGEGVVVWGQKTLQKKASALDRVNVRRLLINLKKFIASTSKYLVFENNTDATRNRFLSTVNPYMESVQQRQGLYAFKVIMDESNNTPDVIDRNILKGDIFIQPAKAAEFIVIDFNVMPTGATFND